MSRWFKQDVNSEQVSIDNYLISGIPTYVYGLKEALSKSTVTSPGAPLAVLYLVHPRGRDYKYTEQVANYLLIKYNAVEQHSRTPLIAVTFDARNHGARTVNERKNGDWQEGNETHAQDMLSSVDGTTVDLEVILDYLVTYISELAQFHLLHIVSGISLGGHVSWRAAAKFGHKLFAVAPIIGSPELAVLLAQRVTKQVDSDHSTYNVLSSDGPWTNLNYDQLKLSDQQQIAWPKSLHNNQIKLDAEVEANIPASLPFLILNGKDDPLVPVIFTRPWANSRAKNITTVISQPGVKHTFTQEMIDELFGWLLELLTVKN